MKSMYSYIRGYFILLAILSSAVFNGFVENKLYALIFNVFMLSLAFYISNIIKKKIAKRVDHFIWLSKRNVLNEIKSDLQIRTLLERRVPIIVKNQRVGHQTFKELLDKYFDVHYPNPLTYERKKEKERIQKADKAKEQ